MSARADRVVEQISAIVWPPQGQERPWSQKTVVDISGTLLANGYSPSVVDRNIKSILDLSTSHMPSENPDFGEVRFEAHEYGYVLWVVDDSAVQSNVPEWLYPILRIARKNNCMLIVFDADASTLDGFETWQW